MTADEAEPTANLPLCVLQDQVSFKFPCDFQITGGFRRAPDDQRLRHKKTDLAGLDEHASDLENGSR